VDALTHWRETVATKGEAATHAQQFALATLDCAFASDKACLSNPAYPHEQDRISRFVDSDLRRQLKRLQTLSQTL